MFLRWTYLLCGCIALFSLATSAVWAGSNKVSPPLPVYLQECGSCHVPFPANFLPKASWGRVMNDLEKHYGSDACLEPVTHKQIETWLQSYGGLGKRAKEEPQQDRITRSAWFERKHREVSEATFKRASIKSPANCMACHRDAAHGDFEDHNVSIPK